MSHSESFDGATSVAVPILPRRQAVGALSVFGPTGPSPRTSTGSSRCSSPPANRIGQALTA